MQSEVVMAGFGGQGIMIIGKILAYAGMEEGREVSWLPSYGPEMRGGTANCTVVLSDRPIGSPVIEAPFASVVLNRPSLERFAPKVKPNGILIINTSLIEIQTERQDLDVCYLPCNQIAIDCGNGKAANMVALGAYLARAKVVQIETVQQQIKQQFTHKPEMVELNLQAMAKGYELAATKEPE